MSDAAVNWPFALAGLAAAVAFVVHGFVGERYAVTPLLADRTLPRITRTLNHLCWHIVTMMLAVLSATALAGAVGWLSRDAVLIAGVIAGGIAAVSLYAGWRTGFPPSRLPSLWVLGAMALLVAAGA